VRGSRHVTPGRDQTSGRAREGGAGKVRPLAGRFLGPVFPIPVAEVGERGARHFRRPLQLDLSPAARAEHLPADFAGLKKPFAVTATDIETGEEVVILEGDLITALRASSCYPGAFEPVQLLGRSLADGGIVNNMPVNAAAFLQAGYTVASDVTTARRAEVLDYSDEHWWERFMATVRLERRSPMVHMVLRSTDIMQSILTDLQYTLHPADLRIQIAMPQFRVESFWAFEEIVKQGEEAAYKSLRSAGLLEDKPLEELSLRPPLKPGKFAIRQRSKLDSGVD
jgi:NTE family protein